MSTRNPAVFTREPRRTHRRHRMGQVIANLAMSIDGFIADQDDGCEELFGFYDNGDVDLVLAEGWPPFHLYEPSATLFREAVARIGCHVMGRRLYDLTNGWQGHPGNEAAIVVLTHVPPATPPDGVPFFSFADVGAAIAKA